MKILNKHKLPKTIVQAVKQIQEDYTGGNSYLSASSLTKPPRIYHLEKRHKDEIEKDVSDMIWSLIGTLVHGLLEKSAEYVDEAKAEERLYKDVLGVLFSGQYDLVEGNVLDDYKVTSVWSVIGDPKEEWIAQANANKLLLHEKGVEVDKLKITAILRDWQKSKAKVDKSYPQTQIKRINLPVWSLEQTEKFLKDRISLLQSHENTPDDALPMCSDKERWRDPTKYAVMKKGGKRALRVLDTAIEAEIFRKTKKEETFIEIREGEDKRCKDYCDVCKFCNYAKEKGYVE